MQLPLIFPEYILNIIPQDKILHFLLSFFLVIIIFWMRKYYIKQTWFLRIFAYSVRDVILIWLFKEFIDLLWFWNAEVADFIANISGIIVPIYLFFTITLYKKLRLSRKIKYEKKYIYRFKQEKKIFKKIEIFLFLLIIWFWNTFYLFLKIPLLALIETIDFVKKWVRVFKK